MFIIIKNLKNNNVYVSTILLNGSSIFFSRDDLEKHFIEYNKSGRRIVDTGGEDVDILNKLLHTMNMGTSVLYDIGYNFIIVDLKYSDEEILDSYHWVDPDILEYVRSELRNYIIDDVCL